MSFLSENKLLFGAVGIALSSAAFGYVVGHYFEQKRSNAGSLQTKRQRVVSTVAVDYVMKYGIREPLPLRKLREVRVCFQQSCSYQLNRIIDFSWLVG